MDFLGTLLHIITPLFIGIIVAWLLDPIVRWLHTKGINRILGTFLVYIVLLLIIVVFLLAFVPVFMSQVNSFINAIPDIFKFLEEWINNVAANFDGMIADFASGAKDDIIQSISDFLTGLSTQLPSMSIKIVSSLFSSIGIVAMGLMIGLYMLFNFDGTFQTFVKFLPKKYRANAEELGSDINTSLRGFVQGTVIIAFIVFSVSSLGFSIVGLESPLIFGLFCGLTNIIPYVGPIIGGIPAGIVGFSQGFTTGILTIVVMVVVQFTESNFLQPLVMGKAMKLHPVTIIIGLLVFGYFFGIIGMILATPCIAGLKTVFLFINRKLKIFDLEIE